MTTLPTFEFCAFRFLTQWQEDEHTLYSAFTATPTPKDIRKALTYFQVARNFPGLKEPAKADFILTSLQKVRADPALSTPDDKVNRMATDLQGEFKRYTLSAASKLLWLSYREPYIVYDSRAVKALRHDFGHRFDDGDYAAYSAEWRQEYTKWQSAIQTAVEQLPKGRLFMRPCSLPDQELVSMAKEGWFMERVFDLFLWEIGGSLRS